MRTPQQIQNLRAAFALMYGPAAFFASDETIDSIADGLQEYVNNTTIKTWIIKVQTNESPISSWEKIEPEPKMPSCSFDAISDKCYSLLIRYPAIDRIQITNSQEPKDVHIFCRD